MNALTLVLGLALGPEGLEEDRLPRSLSESFVPPVAESVDEDHSPLVGIHLGVAHAIDGDSYGFLAGFEWRIHILNWLGVGGGVDFLSKEIVHHFTEGRLLQVPFTWSVQVSPPLDLGVFRPYGLFGGGFTITSVSGTSIGNAHLDATNVNPLYYAGFGMEMALGSTLVLDAGVRYVWAHESSGGVHFDADWRQFTVGVFLKLPR